RMPMSVVVTWINLAAGFHPRRMRQVGRASQNPFPRCSPSRAPSIQATFMPVQQPAVQLARGFAKSAQRIRASRVVSAEDERRARSGGLPRRSSDNRISEAYLFTRYSNI